VGPHALPNIVLANTSVATAVSTGYFNQATLNPLNAELNPIFHLLALLGAHHIFHVSGIRVKKEFKTKG